MSILQSKLIRGAISEPQKLLIYGPEKVGKSTLAMQMPKPVFLDTEGGSRRLAVDRIPIDSLSEFESVIRDPALASYQTVVVDTIDWLESKCADALCKEFKQESIESNDKGSPFSYGKGVVKLGERMMRLLLELDKVAKFANIVLLGHSIVRKIDLPDSMGSYDRYELDLNQKHVAPLLKHWADAILFFNYRIAVKETDAGFGRTEGKAIRVRDRVLYCNHAAFADCGNRHNLGDEEPANIGTIQKAFANVGAPWGEPALSPATAKVAEVVKLARKVAAQAINGAKISPVAADGGQGEPATATISAHETKSPQVEPLEPSGPSRDPDGIPGLFPENGGGRVHPLDLIVGVNEDKVNTFLLERREIQPGQTYRDVAEKYAGKVLRNPVAFMAVAAPLTIGGAK